MGDHAADGSLGLRWGLQTDAGAVKARLPRDVANRLASPEDPAPARPRLRAPALGILASRRASRARVFLRRTYMRYQALAAKMGLSRLSPGARWPIPPRLSEANRNHQLEHVVQPAQVEPGLLGDPVQAMVGRVGVDVYALAHGLDVEVAV